MLGYEIDYNNNLEMKYFNLDSLNFQNKSNNSNLIIFPQDLLKGKRKLTYESVKSLFIIFETVFIKSHLNHYNISMPVNYLNFKLLILNELNKINE